MRATGGKDGPNGTHGGGTMQGTATGLATLRGRATAEDDGSSTAPASPVAPRERRLLAAAVLACLVGGYAIPLAVNAPLLDPDESLHAVIAQEMVERGDYLIPRYLGEPFRDKPVLYFAAQALCLKLFGMNEAAVRVPGMVFTFLGALTTGLLARRLFDERTGWYAGMMSLTLVVPLSLAQAGVHDVALVPWTNLLLLGLLEWDRRIGQDRSGAAALLGPAVMLAAAAFLAVMTKGLIGLGVTGAGFALHLLVARDRNFRRRAAQVAVVVCGAALAAPWFLLMESVSPGYLWYYFVERHLLGFATSTQPHGRAPFWLYVPIVLCGSLPWLQYVVPGLWRIRRESEWPAVRLVACWLGGGMLFLSVAGSKLITYSLPLFPAVAILSAVAWNRFATGRLAEGPTAAFRGLVRFACLVGVPGVPAILLVVGRVWHETFGPGAWIVAGLLSASSVVSFVAFERGRRSVPLIGGAAWVAFGYAMVFGVPVQPILEGFSSREVSEHVRNAPSLPQRVIVVGDKGATILFPLTPAQRAAFRRGQLVEATTADVALWTKLPDDALIVVSKRVLGLSDSPLLERAARAGLDVGRHHVIEPAAPPPVLAGTERARL